MMTRIGRGGTKRIRGRIPCKFSHFPFSRAYSRSMIGRKTSRRLVPRLNFSGKTSLFNQRLLSKEKIYNLSRESQILSFPCLPIDLKPTSEPDTVLSKPPEVKRLVLI